MPSFRHYRSKTMNPEASPDALTYFRERLTKFRRQLVRYLDDPDDEAIHDLRTSIRRLESAYRVLPRPGKTDASDRYLKQARHFFRLNSVIRDCDVMVEKLQQMGQDRKSKLVSELRRTRGQELHHAMSEARKLHACPRPRLKTLPDGARHSTARSRRGSRPRLKTLQGGDSLLNSEVHKRAMKFLSRRPIVLADEAKVEEVHAMRKDAKKLFYLLEQNERLATLKQMIDIKMFQRLTGDIHDADVTIEFLERHRKAHPEVDELLEMQRAERHVLYRELFGFLLDEDWEALARLGQA